MCRPSAPIEGTYLHEVRRPARGAGTSSRVMGYPYTRTDGISCLCPLMKEMHHELASPLAFQDALSGLAGLNHVRNCGVTYGTETKIVAGHSRPSSIRTVQENIPSHRKAFRRFSPGRGHTTAVQPTSGGTTIRRVPPAFIPLMPSSRPLMARFASPTCGKSGHAKKRGS